MLEGPFAFYGGTATTMAADLARSISTGIEVAGGGHEHIVATAPSGSTATQAGRRAGGHDGRRVENNQRMLSAGNKSHARIRELQ